MIEILKNDNVDNQYLLIVRLNGGTKIRVIYQNIHLLFIELNDILLNENYDLHSIEILNITEKLNKYVYINDSIINKLKDTNKSQLAKNSGLNRSLLFAILNYEINFLSKSNYDKLVRSL